MSTTHRATEGDIDLRTPYGGRRPDGHGRGSWAQRNALALVCGGIFLVLLLAQSLTGWQASNSDLADHGQPTQSYVSYLDSGGFAEATFENWESEFLAVFSIVVLGIFLRQRGSSQSKPVWAPNSEIGD